MILVEMSGAGFVCGMLSFTEVRKGTEFLEDSLFLFPFLWEAEAHYVALDGLEFAL